MPKGGVVHLSILIAALAVTAAGDAAEIAQKDVSGYRLKIDQEANFRLNSSVSAGAAYRYCCEPMPTLLAGVPYARLIQNAAYETSLDPVLVHALIFIESRYNHKARSNKGAIGLMQVLPETALRYGVHDPGFSPEANLRAGTRYLRDLMQQFDGRIELVLAAYNAGENAVVNHGYNIPPYQETQRYVPAVLAKYREFGKVARQYRTDYLPDVRREGYGGNESEGGTYKTPQQQGF